MKLDIILSDYASVIRKIVPSVLPYRVSINAFPINHYLWRFKMCSDNWIDAEELALILGITEEIEEEYRSQQISKDPITPDEMLKTGNEIFSAEKDEI